MNRKQQSTQGFVLTTTLAMLMVVSVFIVTTVSIINLNLSTAIRNTNSQQAFNIAEAGINYYLWHLSHASTDFKDGQSTPATPDPTLGFGPYVHDYRNDDGVVTGTYTLWIKQLGTGSTAATVRSIGKTSNGRATRTIEADIGAPSYAAYGLAANGQIWFGANETADGRVHSNAGIRMDGPSNSDVTSANATYIPSSSLGGNGVTVRPGVWCSTSVTTPVNCNTRSKTDWRFPVPAIDFNQLSAERCSLKKIAFADYPATSAAAALPCSAANDPTTRTNAFIPRDSVSAFNDRRGFLIELNSGGTYNLSRVTNETYSYTNNSTYTHPYTSALSRTSIATNLSIPPSGIIFVEDNVWVRTNTTFSGRVTVVASREGSSIAKVVAADDIEYSTQSGADAIGLISEGEFLIAPYAPPRPSGATNFTYKLHTAVIAENNVRFPSTYNGFAGGMPEWTSSINRLEYYGSIGIKSGIWTWVQTSGGVPTSGFEHNSTVHDRNLLYAPPPHFPVTSTYDILNWREVLTTP